VNGACEDEHALQAQVILLQKPAKVVGKDVKPSAELGARKRELLVELQSIEAVQATDEDVLAHSLSNCKDIQELWTNGFATCNDETKDPFMCQPAGWTCAGYEFRGWCRGGAVTRGSSFATGSKFNYPEKNCCVCGGGAEQSEVSDPDCQDAREYDSSCAGWAASGQCETNPSWMATNCQRSCNKCSSSSCVDTMPACAGWAAAGECAQNKAWMSENCMKSCDTCAAKVDTTVMRSVAVQWHRMTNEEALDPGSGAGESQADPEKCQADCDAKKNCGHFVWCNGKCYFKSKALLGNEPRKLNEVCSTYFKAAGLYFSPVPSLLQPSPAPTHTFYVYRAQSGPPYYKNENVNVASIGGVLWYLHNECIFTCTGEGFLAKAGKLGDRKFGIDRIRRFKLTMKATAPLKAKTGRDFSVLKSFDAGENTGPHRNANGKFGVGTGKMSIPEYSEFGFPVGCGYIGRFPHEDWQSGLRYPEAIWYSLTGPCPTMNFKEESKECDDSLPGGLCDHVTGQGNCTYSYEDAGYIMIDELVGITPKWANREEFCKQCKTEGNRGGPGGCGLNFWGENIMDVASNARQVKMAVALFEGRYPNMPKDQALRPPRCDFDQTKYGFV